MKLKALEHSRAFFTVLAAAAMPWGAYVTGQAALAATIFLSFSAALTTVAAWFNESYSLAKAEAAERRARRDSKLEHEGMVSHDTLPTVSDDETLPPGDA